MFNLRSLALVIFKAALGLGLMHSEVDGNYSILFGPRGSINDTHKQLNPRLGLGVEWDFYQRLSMDLMLSNG